MVSKKTVLAVLILLLAYIYAKYVRKTEGEIVKTTSGSVKGVIGVSRDGREFYEWLGIPYAKPPVGELRFARPQPVDEWTGVKDASAYGYECAQLDVFFQIILGQEDCLTLNIHVPKDVPKGKLLPVMVFIHGGYFAGGSSNMYRPNYFMDENVALVTLNYRLGAFGFLNAGHKSARGNMGLADQALAIQWVSQNIDRFGGDPKKITIFGESAGGASVHFQLLHMKNEGLIKNAISQSGTALNAWATLENPIDQAKEFAERVNCPTQNSDEMVKCLKNLDVSILLEGHRTYLDPLRKKTAVFVPTIETIVDDETFLSEHPSKLVVEGKFLKVPWLSGYNEDEGLIISYNFYMNKTVRSRAGENWADFAERLFLLNPEQAKKTGVIRDFYFEKDRQLGSLDAFEELSVAMTDRFFLSGIVQAIEAASPFTSVYAYGYNKTGPSLFNWLISVPHKYPFYVEIVMELIRNFVDTKILGNEVKNYGVCHADELPQLFNVPPLFYVGKEAPTYTFSKDLVKFFVQFSSDPSTAKFRSVPLVKHEPKKPLQIIELNDVPKIKQLLQLSNIKERLEFWRAFEKS